MFSIASIDAYIVAVPLTTPIKMANITIAACDNLIVRVSDGEGRVGWGEASSAPTMTGETAEGMIAAIRFIGLHLEGREVEATSKLDGLIEPTMFGNHAAKSALDMALLDLIGQHQNQPLHEVFGGRLRDRAASLWMLSGAPDEIESARRRLDQGYVAFKVKVGALDPAADLARSRAARAALGDRVTISADANQGYGRDDALTFARGAGEAGLDFFEQPVMGDDIDAMRACAEVASIPIGADEGLHSIADIQRHHDQAAAAGGSLKLIKLGSASRVIEAGRLMDSLDMHINLAGFADTSIGSAAVAHLALALPRLDWDASITNQYLADDLVTEPVAVVDGHIATPEGPGLGITIDEDKLARYRRL